ncbi:MAG TPA: extracellular solute-binding protein, partial [Anaerolineae bacterium]|nr:extracellular solute-binding protein [Anaerolineae bacterium]
PIPVYYQLKLLIQEQIETGELCPGDKVPTEAELCERYHISRTPVRQALLELVREGMLTRRAGRGTFVVPPDKAQITLRIIVSDTRWQWPLQEAARLWNQDHPEKNIVLTFEVVPLRHLYDHLSLAVAQGQAPDISILDSVWVAEFTHRRYLLPPDELDPNWTAKVMESLYPSVLAANSRNGRLCAIPTNADTTVLWYRRDWFESEGLHPPKTWAELVTIGHHFRQPEVRARYGLGRYPLAFVGGRTGGETTTYQLLPFLWSFGADMIKDGKVVLDSPATNQALTFLKGLVHTEKLASPEVVSYRWNSAVQAFAKGEVALALGGTYENYAIRSIANWDMPAFLEHVGFVPLPAGPNGAPATLVGGMTYGLFRQSRHPGEALALLKRMITPEILRPFSLKTGHNSAYKTVAALIRADEDGFLRQTAPLVAQSRSRPSLPSYERVSAHFQEMIEACLTGQLSCKAAAHRAAERIRGTTDVLQA